MVLSSLVSDSRATWTLGTDSSNPYVVSPESAPAIDGVKDPVWSLTNTTSENDINPRFDFEMIYNGSTMYALITVKNDTHTQNESVMLLVSNNGTQLTDPSYFINAKYLDINNVSIDEQLIAGNYYPELTQNITGACSTFNQTGVNWTRYEYAFPYNSSNPSAYMNWTLGGTYLIEIRYYPDYRNTSIYVQTEPMVIAFGIWGSGGNSTSTFNFSADTLTQVIFYSVLGIYGVIGIYVVIARGRVGGPGGGGGRSGKKRRTTAPTQAEEEEEEIDEDFTEGSD
jgi:hypothetical protein